jgi:hypothetical protein
MVGRVNVRRRQLEARSWAAQGRQSPRDSTTACPGSAGTGWERELTDGGHVSARGEREDVEDGMRESKRKMYSQKYVKG